jgi:hypothetical protein
MKSIITLTKVETNKTFIEYLKTRAKSKNITIKNKAIFLKDKLTNMFDTNNDDVRYIDTSIQIVNEIFNHYNENPNNKQFYFSKSTETSKLKVYFFIIIYKLFIYINIYTNHKENMFKFYFSFFIRHDNYVIYLEIKKIINNIFFPGENNDKQVTQIIHNLINDEIITPLIYEDKDQAFSSPDNGDPLHSISGYFEHFENLNEDDNMRDWLVLKGIDEKSTKFELIDDIIITEFRDFPTFIYLFVLENIKNDQSKDECLSLIDIVLDMKSIRNSKP